MEKDIRLEEKIETFLGVFGVGEDYLGPDMMIRLGEVINKIYENDFTN